MPDPDSSLPEAARAAETPPAPRADGLPMQAPDFFEQDHPELIDNAVPSQGYRMLPLIGLGGSAGSLPALQAFFRAMPEESGMAFVVIVHLSPEHASALPQLLARTTAMRVRAARDGDLLEANCVYVIPPGKQLTATDGHLRLTELQRERGPRVAVDLFFRSLADTHGPHAAAIVLSGADGDGSIGIKRIKERGGLTIAQDPDEAEHRGMPQSAISTGMVDWVLRVGEMPGRLLNYRESGARVEVPPEEGPPPAQPAQDDAGDRENALREVLAFLRARTGADFTYYKRATIVRRISRRMQVNSVETLSAYQSFLRTHPGEAGALLQDLLISVTNFFRDRDSFEALELLIPQLFENKGAGDQLRVWVPACATGEEAYSFAMLLMEHARRMENPPTLQVFACDLDENAILQARAGLYPETIAADVSEERLRRFFTHEARGWRIRREVREKVLFAAHDLLKDAPFSRMDLVSCRNLLIYLNCDAQKRALDIFHFALRSGGLLFLGASESIEEASVLFRPLEKKHRIFVQQPTHRLGVPVPLGPGLLLRALQVQDEARHTPVLLGRSFAVPPGPSPGAEAGRGNELLSTGELHLRLAERIAPPSVIVDARHNIVHLSPSAGRFLQLGGGEPTLDILRVVHPMLRVELRAALFQAGESGEALEVAGVPIDLEGRRRAVTLRVAPARELAPGFAIVAFDLREAQEGGTAAGDAPAGAKDSEPLRQLERENESLKGRLRDTVEQYEASNEEQKASNEELQAMNEELRSAAEELETSREELQSVNEELTTVNSEIKSRVEELNHANSDLHNLMAATAIATVFLDRDLRIARYTPSAVSLFRIIPSDLGRPLGDLRHQMDYPELTADAERVLERLMPIERQVRSDEHWLLARLLPYRTLDDRIAGVVLTFVDISAAKRAEEALRASEEQFRRAIEEAPIPVIMHAEDGQVLQISRAWTELTGYTQSDVPTFEAWLNRAYGPGAEKVRQHMQRLFAGTLPQLDAELEVITRSGETRHWAFSASAPGTLRDGRRFIVGMALDITDRKNAEAALVTSESFTKAVLDSLQTEIAVLDHRGAIIAVNESWIRFALENGGQSLAGVSVGSNYLEACQTASAGGELLADQALHRLESLLAGQADEFSLEYPCDTPTERRWFTMHVVRPPEGVGGAVVTHSDITARKLAEEAVRESEARLRTLADAVPQIIWTNSADGIADYFNRRWFEYTGLSLAQSAGPGWQAIVHPEDAPGSGLAWQNALAAGEIFDCEYRLRGADGRYRWFIGRNVPEREATGRVTGWFGTATDIQELKAAEHALGESRERLRIIVESAEEHAIITNDLERNVLSWNPGAESIVGYRAEEIIGQSCDAIFTPEDRAAGSPQQEAETALAAGRAVDERWHVRKDGSRFWGSGVMLPMRDRPGGEAIGFVKIFRDETERRQAKEALERSREEVWAALQEAERARAEAEAAGQAKDHFLAVLSHELRTPLTPIAMATQTLARRQDLAEPVREALAMIRRNVQLESRLVDDLLDVTKIERGKMQLILERSDLHEVVRRALETTEAETQEKSQQLTVELNATEDSLQGDAGRLQQVFWNLLRNASKFTPEGGAIRIVSRDEPGRIVVDVTDTGIGIEPEALARIFDPFTQADASITRKFGGLGLGLAIARAIVEGHHGELRVSSEGEGRGATFSVTLPLAGAL